MRRRLGRSDRIELKNGALPLARSQPGKGLMQEMSPDDFDVSDLVARLGGCQWR
jgi:hypothetical protein